MNDQDMVIIDGYIDIVALEKDRVKANGTPR